MVNSSMYKWKKQVETKNVDLEDFNDEEEIKLEPYR